MKRFIVFGLVLLILLISGCGGKKTESSTVGTELSSVIEMEDNFVERSETFEAEESSSKAEESVKEESAKSVEESSVNEADTSTKKPESTKKPAPESYSDKSSTDVSKVPVGNVAESTAAPTAKPTAKPTAAPTATPTAAPTATPTAAPTAVPTAAPTAAATVQPEENISGSVQGSIGETDIPFEDGGLDVGGSTGNAGGSTEYERYLNMAPVDQQAYMESFESIEGFFEWYNVEREKYEAANPSIEIDGGIVDLEEIAGK